RTRGLCYGVPAHVRQHVGVEPLHRSGPGPAAFGPDPVLQPGGEQDLHAYADAEYRAPELQAARDQLVAGDRAQPRHAGRERADAGHGEPVAFQRELWVGGHLDVGADPLERALRGAQVPRPVVEHHHARPASGHQESTPLVLGTPPARGSGAAAVRSARATALNWASTMWCALRPSMTRMCRQIPAANASDSKMC